MTKIFETNYAEGTERKCIDIEETEGVKYYNKNILRQRFYITQDGMSGAKDLVYRMSLEQAVLYGIKGPMVSCVGNRPWEIAEMMAPAISELVIVDHNHYQIMDMLNEVGPVDGLPPISLEQSPSKCHSLASYYWRGGIVEYAYRTNRKYSILDFDGSVMGHAGLTRAVSNAMNDSAILITWGCKRGRSGDQFLRDWRGNFVSNTDIKLLKQIDVYYGHGQERSVYVLSK